MITATQIISGNVPAGQAGEKNTGGLAGLFDALFSLILEECGTPREEGAAVGAPHQDGERKNSGADVTPEAYAALAAAVCPGVVPDAVQTATDAAEGETPAPLEGAAVTDILEGLNSSCDKDIAPLPAERAEQKQGEENEAIMARMPQITVIADEAESSAAGTEGDARPNGNPCPLENIGDIQGPVTVARPNGDTQTPIANAQAPAAESGVFAPAAGATAAETGPENRDAAGGDEENGRPETARAKFVPADNRTPAAQTAQTAAGSVPAASRETVPEATVQDSVANAMARLDEVLKTYDKPENRQIRIQLEPENLGKLSISLSMGRGGLTARISTENAEVQSVLSNQIGQLIDKLGNSGIQVQRMDVMCADMSFRQDRQFSGGGGYARRQPASGRTRAASPETSDYDALGVYDLYTQIGYSGSSVEYRA